MRLTHKFLFLFLFLFVSGYFSPDAYALNFGSTTNCEYAGGEPTPRGQCQTPVIGNIVTPYGDHVLDCCENTRDTTLRECHNMGGRYLSSSCAEGLKVGTVSDGRSCCNKTPATALPADAEPIFLDYTPLENIPGTTETPQDFPSYVQALYKFVIWGVAIAALLMLIIGGFWYMTAAGNNAQLTTAKKIIWDALLGVFIAFFAYLILFTINPDLVNIDLTSLGAVSSGGGVAIARPLATSYQGPSSGPCNGGQLRGIKSAQCDDASSDLANTMSCMSGELPAGTFYINSISDDNATNNLSACQGDNWTDAGCAHSKNSCHYGGSGSNNYSCAIDVSTKTGASASEIIAAARACGSAREYDEGHHVHVSIPGCTCDGHN